MVRDQLQDDNQIGSVCSANGVKQGEQVGLQRIQHTWNTIPHELIQDFHALPCQDQEGLT